MISIEIKNEIRRLKKEEQLRLNQLEKIDKRNSSNIQRLQNKSLSAIDNFFSDLDNLSSYYQRNDFGKIENDYTFISQKKMDDYELIESGINDMLECHFHYLNFNKKNNENFVITEDLLILEEQFQKSLYGKHEAEMSNIRLRMELAGIEAQINWLNKSNRDDVDLGTDNNDDVDVEVNNKFDYLSKEIKEICGLESYLELYPDVENRLQILRDVVQLANKVVKKYQSQLARYDLRLRALQDEIDFHENLKDSFDFLTEMVNKFQKLICKLDSMKEVVDSFEESKFTKDDQLLIRLKSQFDDNCKEILDVLHNEDSVKRALLKEVNFERKNIENIQDTIDLSVKYLKQIGEDVENIDNFTHERNSSTTKFRMTMMNKENLRMFLFGHTRSNNIKERLKEIKKNIDSIKLDIAFDD